MRKYYKLFFLIFLGFNVSSVFAVTLVPDQVIQEIINQKVDGSEMVGMEVTVNGASTAVWNGTTASDADWELTYDGTDTSNGRWKFTNNSSTPVDTIMLDAFGANAVFDWEFIFMQEGTENSGAGQFLIHEPLPPLPDHEFSGAVAVTGSAIPEGDIYRWLTFDFTGVGGLSENEYLEFTIDTDKFAPVPLPPAAVFLFSGLLGLVGLRQRRHS